VQEETLRLMCCGDRKLSAVNEECTVFSKTQRATSNFRHKKKWHPAKFTLRN